MNEVNQQNNMTANEINESILEAIKVVAVGEIKKINFDQTIKATIINADSAEDGKYWVSNGHSEFWAYSTETKYRAQDKVLVTIPQGDYSNQKIIIAKQADEQNSPLVYVSPFSTMVDLTNNLVTGEYEESIWANEALENDLSECKFSWDQDSKEFTNSAAYQFGKPFYDSGKDKLFERNVTRLGIQAQFSTWLSEYTTIAGNYGITLELTFRNVDSNEITDFKPLLEVPRSNGIYYKISGNVHEEITEEELSYLVTHAPDTIQMSAADASGKKVQTGKYKLRAGGGWVSLYYLATTNEFVKFVTFDSDEFFGDVYAYDTYYTNEAVYDLTELSEYSIVRVRAWLYQRDNFKMLDGDYVPTHVIGDFSDINPNIFMKDPYICLGISSEAFLTDSATLMTSSSPRYYKSLEDAVDSEELDNRQTSNAKEVRLKWVHRNENTNIISLVSEGEFPENYEIRWYRWKLGAHSPDQFAGAHWERFYGCREVADEAGDYGITAEEYQTLMTTNEEWMVEHDPTNQLEFDFYPNVNQSTEKLKAIILKAETETLKKYVVVNDVGSYELEEGDIYYKFAAASNELEFLNADETRSEQTYIDVNALSIRFDDDQKGHYFLYNRAGSVGHEADLEIRTLTAVFDEAETDVYAKSVLDSSMVVKWEFPKEMTMIIPATSCDYDAAQTSNTVFTNTNQVGYFIKKTLNRSFNNNTVRLTALVDGVTYQAEAQMIFGTAGTSGSNYTLDVNWLGERILDVTDPVKARLIGEVTLYDQAGQPVDWDEMSSEAKLEYDWYVSEYINPDINGNNHAEIYDYKYETEDLLYPIFFNTGNITFYNPEYDNAETYGGYYYFLDTKNSLLNDIKELLLIDSTSTDIQLDNRGNLVLADVQVDADGNAVLTETGQVVLVAGSTFPTHFKDSNSIYASKSTLAKFDYDAGKFVYYKDLFSSITATTAIDKATAYYNILNDINTEQLYRKKKQPDNISLTSVLHNEDLYRNVFNVLFSTTNLYQVLLTEYFTDNYDDEYLSLEESLRTANDILTYGNKNIVLQSTEKRNEIVVDEGVTAVLEDSKIITTPVINLLNLATTYDKIHDDTLLEKFPQIFDFDTSISLVKQVYILLEKVINNNETLLAQDENVKLLDTSQKTLSNQVNNARINFYQNVFQTLFNISNLYYRVLNDFANNSSFSSIITFHKTSDNITYTTAIYNINSRRFSYVFNELLSMSAGNCKAYINSTILNDAVQLYDYKVITVNNNSLTEQQADTSEIFEWNKPVLNYVPISNVYGLPEDYDPDTWENPYSGLESGSTFWNTSDIVQKDNRFYKTLYQHLMTDYSESLYNFESLLDNYILSDIYNLKEETFANRAISDDSLLGVKTLSTGNTQSIYYALIYNKTPLEIVNAYNSIITAINNNTAKWMNGNTELDLSNSTDEYFVYNELKRMLFGGTNGSSMENAFALATGPLDLNTSYAENSENILNSVEDIKKTFALQELIDIVPYLQHTPIGLAEQRSRYLTIRHAYNNTINDEDYLIKRNLVADANEINIFNKLINISNLSSAAAGTEPKSFLLNLFGSLSDFEINDSTTIAQYRSNLLYMNFEDTYTDNNSHSLDIYNFKRLSDQYLSSGSYIDFMDTEINNLSNWHNEITLTLDSSNIGEKFLDFVSTYIFDINTNTEPQTLIPSTDLSVSEQDAKIRSVFTASNASTTTANYAQVQPIPTVQATAPFGIYLALEKDIFSNGSQNIYTDILEVYRSIAQRSYSSGEPYPYYYLSQIGQYYNLFKSKNVYSIEDIECSDELKNKILYSLLFTQDYTTSKPMSIYDDFFTQIFNPDIVWDSEVFGNINWNFPGWSTQVEGVIIGDSPAGQDTLMVNLFNITGASSEEIVSRYEESFQSIADVADNVTHLVEANTYLGLKSEIFDGATGYFNILELFRSIACSSFTSGGEEDPATYLDLLSRWYNKLKHTNLHIYNSIDISGNISQDLTNKITYSLLFETPSSNDTIARYDNFIRQVINAEYFSSWVYVGPASGPRYYYTSTNLGAGYDSTVDPGGYAVYQLDSNDPQVMTKYNAITSATEYNFYYKYDGRYYSVHASEVLTEANFYQPFYALFDSEHASENLTWELYADYLLYMYCYGTSSNNVDCINSAPFKSSLKGTISTACSDFFTAAEKTLLTNYGIYNNNNALTNPDQFMYKYDLNNISENWTHTTYDGTLHITNSYYNTVSALCNSAQTMNDYQNIIYGFKENHYELLNAPQNVTNDADITAIYNYLIDTTNYSASNSDIPIYFSNSTLPSGSYSTDPGGYNTANLLRFVSSNDAATNKANWINNYNVLTNLTGNHLYYYNPITELYYTVNTSDYINENNFYKPLFNLYSGDDNTLTWGSYSAALIYLYSCIFLINNNRVYNIAQAPFKTITEFGQATSETPNFFTTSEALWIQNNWNNSTQIFKSRNTDSVNWTTPVENTVTPVEINSSGYSKLSNYLQTTYATSPINYDGLAAFLQSGIDGLFNLAQLTQSDLITATYTYLISQRYEPGTGTTPTEDLTWEQLMNSQNTFWEYYVPCDVVVSSGKYYCATNDRFLYKTNSAPVINNWYLYSNNTGYYEIFTNFLKTIYLAKAEQLSSNTEAMALLELQEVLFNAVKNYYQNIIIKLNSNQVIEVNKTSSNSTFSNNNGYKQLYASVFGELVSYANGNYNTSGNLYEYVSSNGTHDVKLRYFSLLIALVNLNSSNYNTYSSSKLVTSANWVAANNIYNSSNVPITNSLVFSGSRLTQSSVKNCIVILSNTDNTFYDNNNHELSEEEKWQRFANLIFTDITAETYADWLNLIDLYLNDVSATGLDIHLTSNSIEEEYYYIQSVDSSQKFLYNIEKQWTSCFNSNAPYELENMVTLSQLIKVICNLDDFYTLTNIKTLFNNSEENFEDELTKLYSLSDAITSNKNRVINEMANATTIINRLKQNFKQELISHQDDLPKIKVNNSANAQYLHTIFTGSNLLDQLYTGYSIIDNAASSLVKTDNYVNTDATSVEVFNYENGSNQKAYIKINDIYVLDPYESWQENETYYRLAPLTKTRQLQNPLAYSTVDNSNLIQVYPKPGWTTAELMNSLSILSVTLTHFGDYDLPAYFPIILKSGTTENEFNTVTFTAAYAEGATAVRYSSMGDTDYEKNPYRIFAHKLLETQDESGWSLSELNTEASNTDNGWKLLYSRNNLDSISNFIPTLKETYPNIPQVVTEGPNYRFKLPLLAPVSIYIPDAPNYGIQFIYNNQVLWTQPVFVYEDKYPSTTLNQWDGKKILTDEDTGTIVSSAISAGKKEPDNTFTGVMMGDWSRTDTDAAITNQTGLYGFYHGAMSYAFKDNGTGFIGRDGRGRIMFDGNSSTIYSNNWNGLNHAGMFLDIDDGIIKLQSEPFDGNIAKYSYCHTAAKWPGSYTTQDYGDTIDNGDIKLDDEDVKSLLFMCLPSDLKTKKLSELKTIVLNIIKNVIPIPATNLYVENSSNSSIKTHISPNTYYNSLIGKKIYILTNKDDQNYITLSSKESTYPLAIGRVAQISRRKFRVDWDGTAYINDGRFTGMIYATGGEIRGDMKVKGTMTGGSFVGGSFTGGTFTGGTFTGNDITTRNLWADQGVVGGWTINANALTSPDGSTFLFGSVPDVTLLNGRQINNPYGVSIVTNRLAIASAGFTAEFGYLQGLGLANWQTGETYTTNLMGIASSNSSLVMHSSGGEGNAAVRALNQAFLEGGYSSGSVKASIGVNVSTGTDGGPNSILLKAEGGLVVRVKPEKQFGIYARFA